MAIKTDKAIKISQKHLLGIQDLSINDVNLILDEAHTFIKVNQSKNKKIDVLRGKTQINLFFDKPTFNLIGWQTIDIYQNISITYLSSIKRNQKLKKNLFLLPQKK